MSTKKNANVVSGLVGAGILLVIIIIVNVLVGRVGGARLDLTDEKLYTLSPGTAEMMKELERPVTFKFYVSKSARQMPMMLKQYAQRIEDLLREFERSSDGNITLEVFDPKPDSDAEEWAAKYGLAGQRTGMMGGDQLFLGLVAVSGVREGVIPAVQPQMEPQLEYLVTRLVQEVTREEKAKVGVLSSLPVFGTPAPPPGMRARQQQRQPWLILQELDQFYDVVEVDASSEELPEDLKALVLIHPRNLTPQTLYAIDQFVLKGGRLVAFLDAVSMAEREVNPQMAQQAMMQGGSQINQLTGAWGLTYEASMIAADPEAAATLSSPRGGVEHNVSWLTIRQKMFNEEEMSLSGLEVLSFPFGSVFTGEPVEGLEMQPLLTTSAKAGLVAPYLLMGGSSAIMRDLAAEGTNLNLAVKLSGTFKSAFPSGPPTAPGMDTPAFARDSLTESEKPGLVILVGDADLVYDSFAVQVGNFFGQRFAQPINDNFSFALNLLEQATGSDALVALRTRGTFRRPFEKVLKLEKEAREKYYQEEQELLGKVREIEERLNELQATKQEDQKFILSTEQRDEMEKFQEEQFRFQKELKEVRKNLRRDIEVLGYKVKAVNMAGVPLLVALFGIIRGLYRRNRSSRS